MKPAIEHHQRTNRHHPEFHNNGINDMNLLDLIEMLCDWKAATLRNKNGDIRRSLEINSDRFDMNPAIKRLLRNTIAYMGW